MTLQQEVRGKFPVLYVICHEIPSNYGHVIVTRQNKLIFDITLYMMLKGFIYTVSHRTLYVYGANHGKGNIFVRYPVINVPFNLAIMEYQLKVIQYLLVANQLLVNLLPGNYKVSII